MLNPIKTLTIEWKHLEQDGHTCTRSADTDRSLRKAARARRLKVEPLSGGGHVFAADPMPDGTR